MTTRDGNDQAAAARRCTGEPVSWLALERLRLGELPAGERRAVEQHLGVCVACAACLADLDQPLALPPLPAATGPAPFWSRVRSAWRGAGQARMWAPAGVALLLALFLLARPRPLDEPPAERTLAGIKGDGIALSLVRERDGTIDHGATTFTGRDRWKALVTCPAARVVFWDVVVLDGAAAAFPLAPAAPLACGNRVPLPGAFRLDGERPLEVCLLLAADPVDRAAVTARARAHATCAIVRPER